MLYFVGEISPFIGIFFVYAQALQRGQMKASVSLCASIIFITSINYGHNFPTRKNAFYKREPSSTPHIAWSYCLILDII